MAKNNICIIIPTYNNDKTLKRIIDGVLKYSNNIIVVNDGSTDNTLKILSEYPSISQIHFSKNKGKGMALRSGFEYALKNEFEFAITIDSDGQHYPDDIPVFLSELKNSEHTILIGARNMTHDSVPKGSSFGNKFSNFWFKLETGINLNDTQSGFRLYPLKPLNEIKFYTTKFEFEIEVIVKAAWHGISVKNIPIKVLYDDKERVSHFRPYKDFLRISILNTWLVLVAILYIKPRDLLLKIKRKGVKKYFTENILNNSDSPGKKSLSIALGVFIGIAPFWGFQTILVLALAAVFKLNKFIAFLFSNISIPPMIPLIIWGSIKIGSWILNKKINPILNQSPTSSQVIKGLEEYLIGSFVLAFVAAIVFGLVAFVTLKIMKKKSG